MDPLDLQRWKRATVHLETASDSESPYEWHKKWSDAAERLKSGEISLEEYAEATHRASRDIREHGTGLFLVGDGIHYLLTARHVLIDKKGSEHELRRINEEYATWPNDMKHLAELRAHADRARANDQPSNMIFRVPSFEEITAGGNLRGHGLMNLGSRWRAYVLSDEETDIALIDLDAADRRFTADLLQHGHVPVSLEDIGDEPSQEGAEVFAVGFPASTSVVGKLDLHPASANWQSALISLPSFTFGRVSMLHPHLNFFWCDLSIYPGNSGGPVVEAGHLVGIVSAQAQEELYESDSTGEEVGMLGYVGIPFGKIIKSSVVKPFLKELIDRRASA